jgi:hypothetical protein
MQMSIVTGLTEQIKRKFTDDILMGNLLPGSITLLLFDNGAGDLYEDCWGGPDGDGAQLLFVGLGGDSLGAPKGN